MTENFDPRYDPAFQPGYVPRERSRGRDPATEKPATERPTEKPGEPETAAPEVPGVDVDSAVEHPESEPMANPFERTLWIVAAAFVVGGFAFTLWANSLQYVDYGNSATWQQVVQAASWSFSSPMITVGLATAVGLLFRRAVTWRSPE